MQREFGPGERLARDRLTALDAQWFREHRSRIHARVELAVLGARVGALRQIGEQRRIEVASDDRDVEDPRVDTDDARAQTALEHLFGKRAGRNAPEREQRLKASAGEALLAIAADVFEVEVAERHVCEPSATAAATASRIRAS